MISTMYNKYHLEEHPDCIVIDTTWVCNLKCKMCHQDSPTFKIPKAPHIPIELVKRLIPLIKQAPNVYLLGAGEPLMHPKIYEIFSLIKTESPNTRVGTTSNGTLLTERNIDKLINSRLDMISISVDGPTLERGHQKADVTYANLRKLAVEKKRRGVTYPEIHLGFVIGKDNEHELIPAIEFGIEVGIVGITVEPLRIVAPNPLWDDYIRQNNMYDHMDTIVPVFKSAKQLADKHNIKMQTPYIVGI